MARASFLKDKAVSLLRGATVQTFLVSPDSKEGEEDLDDGIVRDGTPEAASGFVDLLSLPKSGFHCVGLKGYDWLWHKHTVDKNENDQRRGGLKWIKRVLLTSSDTCDGSCMKVNEASGDW